MLKIPEKCTDIHEIGNIFQVMRRKKQQDTNPRNIEKETFKQSESRAMTLINRLDLTYIRNMIH